MGGSKRRREIRYLFIFISLSVFSKIGPPEEAEFLQIGGSRRFLHWYYFLRGYCFLQQQEENASIFFKKILFILNIKNKWIERNFRKKDWSIWFMIFRWERTEIESSHEQRKKKWSCWVEICRVVTKESKMTHQMTSFRVHSE